MYFSKLLAALMSLKCTLVMLVGYQDGTDYLKNDNGRILYFRASQLRQISRDSIRLTTDADSDLADMTIYHGTLSPFVSSVKSGPKNYGKGFGDRGLYIAVEGDRGTAEFFADWAYSEASSRLRHTSEAVDSASDGQSIEAIILTGRINPKKDLRVGVFTVGRYTKTDLQEGTLAPDWDRDPSLRVLMENHFDILDLRGLGALELATPTERQLVIHECAGKDTIIWESEEVLPPNTYEWHYQTGDDS